MLLPPPLRSNALVPEDDRLPYELPPENCEVEGLVLGVVPTDDRAGVLPAEGRAPTLPVDGRDPIAPVDGREPTLPVEGLAPPEPQPRDSRVLGLAPLRCIRF